MNLEDVKGDYGNIMYTLKCISDYGAKRELTIGKEYHGVYFRDQTGFFITNDFGGQCTMGIHRFDLVAKIDMRTGQELTIKTTEG